ncbi:hypothetical protein [Acinetobacter sp. MD2(2019)]|uniref:hypothetical protein n=1 Tax=Acinetobacter sp. MD2(2019) TaxID=2605273 RepID=UPI002D1F2375|nr:hypothetical protein [Acinetobacter sp. MD2(2019)]MEB3753202.1 hypothetical protein [Acinetobacter sp. MD2(2019)]
MMHMSHKKLPFLFVLFCNLLLAACASGNHAMFGNTPMKLEYSELQQNTANLFYTNAVQSFGVGVVREQLAQADQQLQPWTQAMLQMQAQYRGRDLVEKQRNTIKYYEVIDARTQVKIIYVFSTNANNDAVLMKFIKMNPNDEVTDELIKNLDQFKVF